MEIIPSVRRSQYSYARRTSDSGREKPLRSPDDSSKRLISLPGSRVLRMEASLSISRRTVPHAPSAVRESLVHTERSSDVPRTCSYWKLYSGLSRDPNEVRGKSAGSFRNNRRFMPRLVIVRNELHVL